MTTQVKKLNKDELTHMRRQIALAEVKDEEDRLKDFELGLKKYPGVREHFFNKEDMKNQPYIKALLRSDSTDALIGELQPQAKQWINIFNAENFAFTTVNRVRVVGDDLILHTRGYRFGNTVEHEQKQKHFYGAEILVNYLIDTNTGDRRFAGLILIKGDLDQTSTDLYLDVKFFRLMSLAVPHYKVSRSYSEAFTPLVKGKIQIYNHTSNNSLFKILNKFIVDNIGGALIVEGFSYVDYKSVFNL